MDFTPLTWSRNWENNSSAACLLPSTPLYSVFNMITFLLILKQLKQASKQSAPYWRLSLNNLCRLAGGMLLGGEAEEAAWRRRSGEEAEEGEEEEDEDEEGEQQMMMREWSNQRLEELYNLQNICRALLHSRQGRLRHDSREYAAGNGGEAALKRKSPYILKRQATHLSKSRRPYILKRSEIY
ncbi:neurotensin/neuromedin N isoform 8-T9 [Syngnathus typhle]